MKAGLPLQLLQLLRISLKDLAAAISAIAFLLLFIASFTYVYFAKDLTSSEALRNKTDTGVVLLDRNGTPFFRFYQAKNKTYMPLSQISGNLKEAVVAVEDKKFYQHPGFSLEAIAAALIADIKRGELVYGGSTITQQLVKNSLLGSKKSFLRKYQELILAAELERRFGKDSILEMYLSSVYWGEGASGAEAAAQTYFGKKAQDLSLAESAFLAGLLPAPSKYSPSLADGEAVKSRQRFVLEEMVEAGYITTLEKEEAEKEPLTFKIEDNQFQNRAPHFALMVVDELIDKYGEETVAHSAFQVRTTLDLNWQEFAQKTVSQHVAKLSVNKASNGAAVVLDPKTGEVLALVGSKDWFEPNFGKINMVVSPRQPGSAFKPVVYSAAFESRLVTPATILKDQPRAFTTYANCRSESCRFRPKNFDSRFRGEVSVRRALANSLNVPSVEVMSKVGVPASLEMANRLGIDGLQDPSNYGLSLVLGAGEVKLLELTSAYGVFANQGLKNEPALILEIEDKFNRTIYTHRPLPKRVLEREVAFLISSILSDNKARAEVFGSSLNISKAAAVKTGTTEDFIDSLTVGYSPTLAVGVWVGNSNRQPMDNIAGSLGAAPIWRNLIEEFLKGRSGEQFEKPVGVVALTVCRGNGLRLAGSDPAGYTEYFIRGTEPRGNCILKKPSVIGEKPD